MRPSKSKLIGVGINSFVMRQMEDDFVGTKITKEQMEEIFVQTASKMNKNESEEGYASFCQIVKLNYDLKSPIVKIDDNNRHLLVSIYKARRPNELSNLTRYFLKGSVELVKADHIEVILYTKEQLIKEKEEYTGADYDILCINAEPAELSSPMTPNTMIRNHLGSDFGGSGATLDKKKYEESVAFWQEHAMIE